MEIGDEGEVIEIEKNMVLKAKIRKGRDGNGEGGGTAKMEELGICFLKFKGIWRQSWRPGESEGKGKIGLGTW